MFKLLKKYWQKIVDFFTKMFNSSQPNSSSSSPPTPKMYYTTIRLIGARGSGKTTYLATLLRLPYQMSKNSIVKRITPMDAEAEQLLIQSVNILEEGKDFEPTVASIPNVNSRCNIKIILEESNDQEAEITLETKDFSGEIFSEIFTTKFADDYLNECAKANGLLLLMDGTKDHEDEKYEMNMREFMKKLKEQGEDGWQGKIAVVLTKCENFNIYHLRQALFSEYDNNREYKHFSRQERREKVEQELVTRLYPRTMEALTQGCSKNITVSYFTASSFGVYGADKQPNHDTGVDDTVVPPRPYYKIKNKGNWKPFGLITPLYWLCTGERHPDLEDL